MYTSATFKRLKTMKTDAGIKTKKSGIHLDFTFHSFLVSKKMPHIKLKVSFVFFAYNKLKTCPQQQSTIPKAETLCPKISASNQLHSAFHKYTMLNMKFIHM